MDVIAVVDDEESVRNAVVRVLQAAGYAARGFASGEEFLKSWHSDRPDFVLLDLQMPGLSGLEVQQALKLEGARFPVAIMTAYESPNAPEECLREGAVAYLSKPFDAAALLQAVTGTADSPAPCPKVQ
ncbi:MAG: response regulator transcription factor [Steroidobacteraceae bacterium]